MTDLTKERSLREWIALVVESVTEEDELQEFCGAGAGGGLMGYNLPLGANPDAYGRRLNKPKKRKNKANEKK